MTSRDARSDVRDLRRDLVLAAQSALAAAGDRLPRAPETTQVARLVAAANEAVCVEEVENYLRYQVARGARWNKKQQRMEYHIWDEALADAVMKKARSVLQPLEEDDPQRIEAWRLYASYFLREFRYRKEVERARSKARQRPSPSKRKT